LGGGRLDSVYQNANFCSWNTLKVPPYRTPPFAFPTDGHASAWTRAYFAQDLIIRPWSVIGPSHGVGMLAVIQDYAVPRCVRHTRPISRMCGRGWLAIKTSSRLLMTGRSAKLTTWRQCCRCRDTVEDVVWLMERMDDAPLNASAVRPTCGESRADNSLGLIDWWSFDTIDQPTRLTRTHSTRNTQRTFSVVRLLITFGPFCNGLLYVFMLGLVESNRRMCYPVWIHCCKRSNYDFWIAQGSAKTRLK